ncbi:hypothetical protein MK632_27025 [Rhizobium changzhiense]|uniref:hypothetical protein n=1 Tax=Rhizobium changzhiense TaxID=2692317 RepID=UPI001F0C04F7|nr:hypothetical protein [Rhizobium changzhiense]MCH4549362.1 hypothetical protein [Rhizobium changzhiense]
MDRDNKRTRANASSPGRLGGAEERRDLLDLPQGPISNVAEQLVTSNPRDTALNLRNFKSLAKETLSAVREAEQGKETALTTFERRNKQLGQSAIELADKLTDGLGFDSDAVALLKVQAAGNVAHYIDPAKQTALVNRISNMEPTDQATGVLLVSHNFSKFDDNNKSRIFELARELAADPHLHHESKANAHNAIFVAYHDLDANQRAQAHSLPAISASLQHIQPPRHVAEGRSANLDEHIRSIEKSVRDTVGPQTSTEQLQRAGKIAQSISHAYNHARDDLRPSSRSRDAAGSRDRTGR